MSALSVPNPQRENHARCVKSTTYSVLVFSASGLLSGSWERVRLCTLMGAIAALGLLGTIPGLRALSSEGCWGLGGWGALLGSGVGGENGNLVIVRTRDLQALQHDESCYETTNSTGSAC